MRSKGGEGGRTFTEEARRRQIVECAIETLAEVGFAQTSLARIAQRANISKGVISYHFDGKDELLHEALVHVYTVGAEYIVAHMLAEDTSRGRLRAYITANIAFLGENLQKALAVGEIALNLRDENGKLRYGAHTDEPLLQPLEDIFVAGQQAGEFREFSPRVMAIALRKTIDGVGDHLLHGSLDAETFAAELADLFDHATAATTRHDVALQSS